jgi:ferredoxin
MYHLYFWHNTAVDWRDVGAVTEVHSQGNCGACWAITAVETIESAIYLNKGTLYDLSETEVIVCAEDCEMCKLLRSLFVILLQRFVSSIL